MSLCAACTVITSCSRTNDTVLAARQQAWLDLILSTHNSSDEKDVRLLDSINRLAPPTDRHERVLWQLAQAWLTAAQTNRGVNDSLIVPIVDYLERHGTPAEQTEALLLHVRKPCKQLWRAATRGWKCAAGNCSPASTCNAPT